ncbi:MAG: phosphotransferase [Acidimicrobiales bacterium]
MGISDATDPEIPLTGGALNVVARVGDTVRRPSGPWTPSVHALLDHVRERGFELAPAPLGIDDRGREMLSYFEGTTVGWSIPWPDFVRTEDLLGQVGEATAAYHRAVADFRPEGPVPWRSGVAVLGDDEIVCHHDIAPYNVVLRDGELVGLIDWDLAGPGTVRSELAFVAWQWVPLHGPLVTQMLGWTSPPARSRRLRILLDAYGLVDRTGFIDHVVRRVEYNRDVMVANAARGDAAYQALVDQGHVGGMEEALGFLAENGPALQGGL